MAFDLEKFVISAGKSLSDSTLAATKFCMDAARKADVFWRSPDADTVKEIGGWLINNPGKALRTAALLLFIGQSATNKPEKTEFVPGLIEGIVISAKQDLAAAAEPLELEEAVESIRVAVSSELTELTEKLRKTDPEKLEGSLKTGITKVGALIRGLQDAWKKGYEPPKPKVRYVKPKPVIAITPVAPVPVPVPVPAPAPVPE